MNRSLLTGLIVGGVAVVAVGAYAGTRLSRDYAEVVAVEPAFDSRRTAREVCRDESVTEQVPVKDEKRIAGAAIGAVIGGVLGHQVGSGDGNTAATAAGAVAGGYAGSKVQKHMQENNTETSIQQRCATVYDNEKVPAGYEVSYLLDGQQGVVRMDHDPGKRIPVKNGELDLNRS
ncbi:MAG TPA: glycine zipper 2TM domain-containing protein [Steroidobacteraceae bacterium]|nr:glycine zipper 2TM domain-containing protein [Steroidobacteraceae bacterium]